MSSAEAAAGETGAGDGQAGGVPAADAERAAEPALREAEGRPAEAVGRFRRIPGEPVAVHKSTMLGPFDWYTVIALGMAAAVVAAVVLVAWLTGQIRPPRK
jgi:hypothetical protein